MILRICRKRMLDTGYWMLDTGCGMQDAGCRIIDK